MGQDIRMPEVSPGLEAAKLLRWMVAPGDLVADGDPIAEIETEKAVLEIDAPGSGRIGVLMVADGTPEVAVGAPIATLVTAEAQAAEPAASPEPAPNAGADAAAHAPVPGHSGQAAGAPPPRAAPRQATFREALRAALTEEMRRDASVFVIGDGVGAAQGAYRVTEGLIGEFGAGRVVDAPPLAGALAGLAVGAAFAGLRPVVEFTSFAQALAALDQIVNSAAKAGYMTDGALSVPVVFRGPHGGAAQTGAQRSQDVAAWLSHVPGLRVAAASSAADAKGLLKAAIRDPNPVILLESESLYGQRTAMPVNAEYLVPLGRARIWREGADVTLVSYGIGMAATLEAADLLAQDGIAAEVIDLRSLRPLDTATLIASVRKTNRCVTVEQGWPQGGIGQQVSAVLMTGAFDWLDAPVRILTAADVPQPYAAGLLSAALPGPMDIADAARQVLYR